MAVTPKIRRSFKGAPVEAALGGSGVTSATSTSITLSSSPSTWPTGKFFVVVAPGTASEEKMCVTLSGSTLTVVDPNVSSTAASVNGRGVDDTTARSSIAVGSVVYPVATARDFDEANSLTSTYANQGGIVYMGDPSFTQLGIGSAAQVLRVNSGATAPEWGQVATAGIADGAVTSAKIADDTIVNTDINAAAAIVDTKLATISTADKVSISALNIDGASDIGADLADADLIIVDDGATGTNRKSAVSRFAKFLFSKVSGNVTITDAGVSTLDINGATAIGADLADSDAIMVYDASATANRNSAISRFAKYLFGKVSGDITVTEAGVAAIGSGKVTPSMMNATAWTTTHTPTYSGIGVSSTTFRYIELGKVIHFFMIATLDSNGITSNTHTISLPKAASVQSMLTGMNAVIENATAERYLCTTVGVTTSTIRLFYPTINGELSVVDSTTPFDTSTGDTIIISGTYQVA